NNGDISYLPWAREDLGLIAGAHPKKKHPRPRKASITLIQIAAGLPSPAENGAGRLLVPLLPPPAGSACRSDEWRGSRPLAELWMLMGAQKSIHAGKGWFLFEQSTDPFSQIIVRYCSLLLQIVVFYSEICLLMLMLLCLFY
ncbi:hypothetical protein B296_00045998, partial [Ensete ventricosum]